MHKHNTRESSTRFQIEVNSPVNNSIGVQVVQCFDELFGNLLNSFLWKSLVVLKNVEQFTLGVLRDHTEISICFKCIKHQNNVLMVQLAKNSNFLAEVLDVLFTFSMLVNKLHGNREPSVFASSLWTS